MLLNASAGPRRVWCAPQGFEGVVRFQAPSVITPVRQDAQGVTYRPRAANSAAVNGRFRSCILCRRPSCPSTGFSGSTVQIGQNLSVADFALALDFLNGCQQHRLVLVARRVSRYSHVRMVGKRRALDEIAARRRADDEKRQTRTAAVGCCDPSISDGSVVASSRAWCPADSWGRAAMRQFVRPVKQGRNREC